MTHPNVPFPEGIPDETGGKRNRLSDAEYNSLTEVDKTNVHISRWLRTLRSTGDPNYQRARELVADIKQIDLSSSNGKTLMRRHETYEADKARKLDGTNKEFPGRGFISEKGVPSYIDSTGTQQNLRTRETNPNTGEVSFPQQEILRRFADGILKSFNGGQGEVFIDFAPTKDNSKSAPVTSDEVEASQDGTPRQTRNLVAQNTPGQPQTDRDRLIDYLNAPGMWTNEVGQEPKLKTKLKFGAGNVATVYFSPDYEEDGDDDEDLDEMFAGLL